VSDAESERARSRFFAWKSSHAHLADDPAEVWAAAWRAGAWDALKQNTTLGLNLAQITQRLEDLAQLYSDVGEERRIDRELEEVSAYYRSEP
jgi:hypothetical protein